SPEHLGRRVRLSAVGSGYSSPRSTLRFGSIWHHQVNVRAAQCLRQFVERDYGGIALALFQPAQVLLGEAPAFGDLFLGQAFVTAYACEIAPHQFAHVHDRTMPFYTF